MPIPYASRDAVGLAIAWVEEDDELVGEILGRYGLRGEALDLVLGAVSLVRFDVAGDDDGELAEALYALALAKASA